MYICKVETLNYIKEDEKAYLRYSYFCNYFWFCRE